MTVTTPDLTRAAGIAAVVAVVGLAPAPQIRPKPAPANPASFHARRPDAPNPQEIP